ncbi:unnamed protein product, partial [Timema podura]|nr:unnamed protein product [Timema podura]
MDRVSNEWVLKECSLKGNPKVQCMLCWFGHVERLDVDRVTKQKYEDWVYAQFLAYPVEEQHSSQCVDLQNVETNLPPSNRTFFLNCSSSYVKYASIKFKTERLTWAQTSARFILRLELDLAKLEKFMEMKDIVYLSTQGHVKITQPDNYNSSMNTRPDLVQVSTMFRINEPRKVAKYIIALSIIAGILLILFIVTGLIKAGFFKREKKEELKQLMSTE